MTRFAANATLALLLLAGCQGSDEAADRAALLALDRRIDQALVDADAGTLRAIYTDDFEYVHSGAAWVDDKESWLAKVPVSKGYYVRRRNEAVQVRLYGDTALLSTFLITEQKPAVTSEGVGPAAPRNRAHQLRVYRRGAAGWQLAYQHLTWAVDRPDQGMAMMRFLQDSGFSADRHFTWPADSTVLPTP